ncbi:MAG: phenylacetate--CoA ligase [Candidatus Omnitrophota bacterium]
MPILEIDRETMSREELEQLQLERLQAILNRVIRNVAFYRNWFSQEKILPSDLRSLGDLVRLPLIDRQTLAANHPYGMFAVPLREVVRLHPSAPGYGDPVVIGYTKKDVLVWTELKARSFAAAEMSPNDLVQVYLDYLLFPGAVVAHYGAEQLGACVTPLYNCPISDQIEIMRNYRTTVLICTPTRAIHIIRYMRERGVDPKSLFLHTVVLVGERLSQNVRKQIEENLQVNVFIQYGVPEICSPGVAYECGQKNGLHLNEDHFLAEIVHPETGERLPEGERGELVLTTLTKEAFPLIRYRTGDITCLYGEACACGRTFLRMESVASRTDDLLVVEGTEFLPSEIGHVLSRVEHVTANYSLTILREETTDRIELDVEVTPEIFQDRIKTLESLRGNIEEALFERLRIRPMVRLVEPMSLHGRERIIDKRNQNG